MQFEVIRNPGVLNGEFIWQIQFGHSILKSKFAFFHRIIKGLYDTDFDHGVFDVDPQQIFFIESLSLNNKRITDVGDPTQNNDAATKKYIDDEIAKIPKPTQSQDSLPLDGSKSMTGTLNMGGNIIDNNNC